MNILHTRLNSRILLAMGLCASITGCSYMPWLSAHDTNLDTPLKKAKVQHIELNYSRDFMHDLLGVPQITNSTPAGFKSGLSYERYQYATAEIQVLYNNNNVVAYTLRNYNPRKPELKRRYRWWGGDDKWQFGKSSFAEIGQRHEIDNDYKKEQYRCRIEQSKLDQAGTHQVWFSSFHANWQAKDKPTALLNLDMNAICPEQAKEHKSCLSQLKNYVCVLGKDSLG